MDQWLSWQTLAAISPFAPLARQTIAGPAREESDWLESSVHDQSSFPFQLDWENDDKGFSVQK